MPDRLVAVGDDFTLPPEIIATLDIPAAAADIGAQPAGDYATVSQLKTDEQIRAAVGAYFFRPTSVGAARPATAVMVVWFYPTQPTNMADGDVHIPIAALA